MGNCFSKKGRRHRAAFQVSETRTDTSRSASHPSYSASQGKALDDTVRKTATNSRRKSKQPVESAAGLTIRQKPHDEPINCLSTGAAAWDLMTASDDKSVCLFDWKSSGVNRTWNIGKKATRVCHAETGSLLLAGSRDGSIHELSSEQETRSWSAHELSVTALSTNYDGTNAFSGSRDCKVALWDVETAMEVSQSKISRNVVTWADWIRGDDVVVQSSEDLTLRLWDVRTFGIVKSFTGHNNILTCCSSSPDGHLLLSCSNGFDGAGCEVKVWDSRYGILFNMKGHMQTVVSCKFLSFGSELAKYVVTVSADNSMKVWSLQDGACVTTSDIPPQDRPTCMDVAFDNSSDCEVVSVGSQAGGLNCYSIDRSGTSQWLYTTST